MLFDFFLKPKPQQKLPFITDIHNHIVPGVDDGAPDIDKSMFLLDQMHGWGLRRIFPSPHSTQDKFENTPASVEPHFEELRRAAAACATDMTISDFHMEYRVDEFFVSQLEAGNIVHLPQNYLLIENAFSHEPWGLENMVIRLQHLGYKPILAHPERYRYYSLHHRNRYRELANIGLYYQINILSLAGHYGKTERETALFLLKNNMAQFVGTDLHRTSQVETMNRYLSSRTFIKDCKLFDSLYNDEL